MSNTRAKRGVTRLVLLGYRGCGKTTVGRLVADQLGWEFVDTDELVERAAARTIATIFADDGEDAFRGLEAQAVADAVRRGRCVISVGGGAVASEPSRTLLSAAGPCVWLTAPAEELHRRLEADPRSASQRPALTDTPGLAEVERVLAERRPFYEAVADVQVETGDRVVADIVQEVVALVANEG